MVQKLEVASPFASPFADKERIDWQIPAWKRHQKSGRSTCQNTPSPLLSVLSAAQFQPVHRNDPCLLAQKACGQRAVHHGSPLQLTWKEVWDDHLQ